MANNDPTTSVAAGRGAAVAAGTDHEPEQMTSKQADELRALCDKHDVAFDHTLTREAADARIAELRDDSLLDTPRDL